MPFNFDSPYKSVSIIDFWQRWHITLSRFLRDYLYFPLGGNRHGSVRRYTNLMIVMLLGGLWHGAGWTFVAWGAAHGLFLCVAHAWRTLAAGLIHSGHRPAAHAGVLAPHLRRRDRSLGDLQVSRLCDRHHPIVRHGFAGAGRVAGYRCRKLAAHCERGRRLLDLGGAGDRRSPAELATMGRGTPVQDAC